MQPRWAAAPCSVLAERQLSSRGTPLPAGHMAFSFVVLAPAALCVPWHAHRAALSRQWRGVAAVGVTSSASVALNLMSLQDISLTLNQVIRCGGGGMCTQHTGWVPHTGGAPSAGAAWRRHRYWNARPPPLSPPPTRPPCRSSSIPVVTCLLAVVIERKRPSGREAAALATLSAGVMLAVWQGRLEGGGAAIALCAASTLCSGAMMTLSGRLLSERLGVARLAFYTAPVSLACLLPFMLALERRRFLAFWPHHRGGVALVVGLTSVTAVTYNLVRAAARRHACCTCLGLAADGRCRRRLSLLPTRAAALPTAHSLQVHSLMIQRTSAVTTTVLGEVKILGLLVLSAAVLGGACRRRRGVGAQAWCRRHGRLTGPGARRALQARPASLRPSFCWAAPWRWLDSRCTPTHSSASCAAPCSRRWRPCWPTREQAAAAQAPAYRRAAAAASPGS